MSNPIIDIQLGLDVATSISVIFAAVSLLYSQARKRKQQQKHYAVDNLKGFLVWLHQQSILFYKLCDELEYAEDQDNNSDNSEKDSKFYKIIDLIEDISSELKVQANIFFPIFMGYKPQQFIELHEESLLFIQNIKNTSTSRLSLKNINDIEHYIEKTIITVANIIKDHIDS